jgi:hypothetical protein
MKISHTYRYTKLLLKSIKNFNSAQNSYRITCSPQVEVKVDIIMGKTNLMFLRGQN